MNLLRIYFSGQWHDAASPVPWALTDANGTLLQSGTSPLSALPRGFECVAIAASDRVLAVPVKLPEGRRRQAALPYAAEEHTLPDPEENHVVPGPTLASGHTLLAVADKSWVSRIVGACKTSGLSLRRMVAETFLPPVGANSWTLVWNGHAGFVRTGAASGVALDGDNETTPAALALCLHAGHPARIELRYAKETPEAQRTLPHWQAVPPISLGPVWDWQRAPIPPDALNLLWGAFAPSLNIGEWWPKLKPAALIFLAALGVEILGTNIEWAALAGEKRTLMHEMERNFHTAFGEDSMLVDAPLQMQRNLAQLRHAAGQPDAGDFLPLLDAASRALPQGSVRALRYAPGQLDADVALPPGYDFAGLQRRLQGNGLAAQISNIQDAENGAQARIALRAGE